MNDTPLAGTAASVPRPRRGTRRVARLLLLLVLGLAAIAAVALALHGLDFAAPVHVVIDGEEVFGGLDLGTLPPAQKVAMSTVVVLALLSALVIVPVALVVGVLALALIVLMIVGLPVLAVLSVAALLLSPLILLAWLLWKAIAS